MSVSESVSLEFFNCIPAVQATLGVDGWFSGYSSLAGDGSGTTHSQVLQDDRSAAQRRTTALRFTNVEVSHGHGNGVSRVEGMFALRGPSRGQANHGEIYHAMGAVENTANVGRNIAMLGTAGEISFANWVKAVPWLVPNMASNLLPNESYFQSIVVNYNGLTMRVMCLGYWVNLERLADLGLGLPWIPGLD